MKFLKTYEEVTIYNIGDYIMLDLEEVIKNVRINYPGTNKDEYPNDVLGKVIDTFSYSHVAHGQTAYKVKLSNGTEYLLIRSEIKRLLTPKEKIEYDIRLDVNKYNL